MRQVAKLVIIDNDNKYLLMYRSSHPVFGNDPDLPGGTLEEGEQPLETMVREVDEEAGIAIDPSNVRLVYEGAEYSKNGTHYSLYETKLPERPPVIMSWEHTSYAWLDRDDFLERSKNAEDTYMHMVYETLKGAPAR
jgi:8-oxo-dGTP pyrophosphatase MutT (NUDIX family)